ILDYSNFVGMFLYFENEEEITNYVIDTCQARGDKNINNFNEAINYLSSENITISNVINLFIDEKKWYEFKSKYDKLLKEIKK
ncbi:MAG: hypothetical protein K2H11_01535, partial [Malacoplasma sp.]|nr:hypothetical protein [Malacoplasma sp.]